MTVDTTIRMSEQWKPIAGFPGYEVSDMGNVRSHRVWRGQPGPRILRKLNGNRGYYTVALSDPDGKKVKPTIHSLVMAAFVGKRPEDMQVRHLNGDAHDNRLENLAYGTSAENYGDMFLHGTHPMASRTHCKNGHEFNETNSRVELSPNGSAFRRCLQCKKDHRTWGDRLASAKREAWRAGYAAGIKAASRGEVA